MPLFVNILAFQVGWFACVLGAANAAPLLGPAIVAAVVTLHLSRSNKPGREMTLVLAAGFVGTVWDSALVAAGWLQYPSGNLIPGFAPYWIVAMWMLFATTLNVSLLWLRRRTVLAVILGGLSGPLTFLAGSGLGGVTFVEPRSGLIALALGWAVILPALSILSSRLDGMAVAVSNERAHV
jgi:hypothetical protein